MAQTNSWYVVAKSDNRYKYDFTSILNRSHVFKNRQMLLRSEIKCNLFVKRN